MALKPGHVVIGVGLQMANHPEVLAKTRERRDWMLERQATKDGYKLAQPLQVEELLFYGEYVPTGKIVEDEDGELVPERVWEDRTAEDNAPVLRVQWEAAAHR